LIPHDIRSRGTSTTISLHRKDKIGDDAFGLDANWPIRLPSAHYSKKFVSNRVHKRHLPHVSTLALFIYRCDSVCSSEDNCLLRGSCGVRWHSLKSAKSRWQLREHGLTVDSSDDDLVLP